MGDGLVSALVGSKRLPGFGRRRYRWIFLGTLVWNVSAVVPLTTRLGRNFSSVFIVMLPSGVFVATLAWIVFNATCERLGREATSRLGLSGWQRGDKLDGLTQPICPECGERFEHEPSRAEWESSLIRVRCG